MAKAIVMQPETTAELPEPVDDYELYEIAFQANAARALLHECEASEKDIRLTGVSYLLTRIAKDCERLAEIADRYSAALHQRR